MPERLSGGPIDPATIRVRSLAGSDALALADETTAIYGAVFSEAPYFETAENIRGFTARLRGDTAGEGFRFVVAEHAGGPVGFAYGHASRPGQWWHDVVRRAIGPAQAAFWLVDAFELVELALLPAYRGMRLGARLYDELFRELPHQTALASTADQESEAMRLYRRRGWNVVRRGFVFPGSSFVSAIIGLDLRRGTPA